MGKRGPQPGFKARKAEQAALEAQGGAVASAPAKAAAKKAPAKASAPAAAPAPAAAAVPLYASTPEEVAKLPQWHRDHPGKLAGEALRLLAHRMGISRSEAQASSDAKLRQQIGLAQVRWSAESAPVPADAAAAVT